MKQARKKLTTAIGMAVGVTVLAGAAFAGYNTSNGYEAGKKAIKGLLNNENYTANFEIKMSVDGSEIAKTSVSELYDRNGDVKLNNTEKSESDSSYFFGSMEYKSYVQDGSYISVYKDNIENKEQTSVYDNNTYMGRGIFDAMNNINNDDRETTDKIIRFVELAGDTFVGDLKNNIVYVSGDDNSSTYEINLDALQIPEVVNAGLSAMFSSMSKYDNEEPYMVLGTDPIVKSASLKFTVDSEGRLTGADANVTMSGNGHEAAIDLSGTITDYGTTKPERIDVSTLQNVHNYEMDDYGIAEVEYESVNEEAESKNLHVDENGNVLNSDDEIVGTVEINGDGDGVIVYNQR